MKKLLCIIAMGCCASLAARAQQVSLSDTLSYSSNGISLSANNNFSYVQNTNGANLLQWTFYGTTDTVYGVSPKISNGVLRVQNTSPTNTAPNSFSFGNSSTNYPNSVNPGESARIRFNPDPTGNLHGSASTSGGTQTVSAVWLPN